MSLAKYLLSSIVQINTDSVSRNTKGQGDRREEMSNDTCLNRTAELKLTSAVLAIHNRITHEEPTRNEYIEEWIKGVEDVS